MIIVVAPARQQNTIHSRNKNDEDANTWLFMLNILDNLCLLCVYFGRHTRLFIFNNTKLIYFKFWIQVNGKYNWKTINA